MVTSLKSAKRSTISLKFAVEEDFAVVDDDDALAQLLDVGHVMAREQNRGFLLGIVAANEFAHGFLGNDIQADGRFVEKQHLGLMQQRRDQLHFHAFAEGKFAHADVELVFDGEQFAHFGDGAFETVGGDAVNFCVQFERFARGQIPPQLVFLAEHERKLAAITISAFPRCITEHLGGAARRIKQAGEHFERGGFARAVRAEKTDQFAGFNLETARR